MEGHAHMPEPRCYFALMDYDLRFRYIDPVFRACLAEQAPHLLYTQLFRWMHPEELQAAQADAESFLRSRTLFGTVTRCRFYRPSAMREALGAPPTGENTLADMTSLDQTWTQLKIVASWIGEGTILAFFHAVVDRDPSADADEHDLSPWSNWCGPRDWDPTESFLSTEERNAISRCMLDMEREAQQKEAYDAHPYDPDAPPRYVFQMLTNNDARLVLSQPAPRYIGSAASGQSSVDYDAIEYARLAKEVWEKPREHSNEAKSNCTRRFRSKHPIMKNGVLTTIESVVVRYNSICFACFQTRGIFSNPKNEVPRIDTSSPALSPAIPQHFDDHFRRSISTTSLPNPSPSMSMSLLGKRRRSRSEAPLQGHKPMPLPLAETSNYYARTAAMHSPWAVDSEDDGLSPTVATGAALLGSLTHARPSHSQYPPTSYPYQSNVSHSHEYATSPQPPPIPVHHDNYSPAPQYQQPYHSMLSAPQQTNNSNVSMPPPFMPSYQHSYPSPLPYGYYGPSASSSAPGPSGYHESRSAPPPEAPMARPHSGFGREAGHDMQRSRSAAEIAREESPRNSPQPKLEREDSTNEPLSDSQNTSSAAARRQRRQAREAEAGRTCASCGTSNSPEWRKGPTGIKSLCNACGLRYARSVARDARKEAEAQAAAEGKPPPQFGKKKKTAVRNDSPFEARPRSNSQDPSGSQPLNRPPLMHHSSADSVQRPTSSSHSQDSSSWQPPPPALPRMDHPRPGHAISQWR